MQLITLQCSWLFKTKRALPDSKGRRRWTGQGSHLPPAAKWKEPEPQAGTGNRLYSSFK